MATTSAPSPAGVVRRPRRTLRFSRDDELVRLVRCGDESAFEAIYDRHHRGILAFCRHMLGNREEGEDAVQHTFAAAYRDIVGTDKPIQLKAWLYAIARNRCLSLLRARREQVGLEDAEPATEGLASEVQRRQDLRDMLRDLQALPDDQRAALVLAELGALSHEEIAVSLGVRKEKVKALVFQARESLAASRQAREVDCREIQEQLSMLRGGALRRTSIRRHVEQCAVCQEFRAEVQRQRSAMALLLPVIPSMGLREGVMAAIIGGGGTAGGGAIIGGGAAAGGSLLAGSGAKGLAAKVLTIAAAAGAATGGGLMGIDKLSEAPADSRDPLALAPHEETTIKLVRDLRRRADTTARKRVADHLAARTGGAVTTSAPKARADRDRAVGPRRAETPPKRRRQRDDDPAADRTTRSSAPVTRPAVEQSAPAAPQPPAAAPVPVTGDTAPAKNDEKPEQAGKAPPAPAEKQAGSIPPGLRKKGGRPPGQARKDAGALPPGPPEEDADRRPPGHAEEDAHRRPPDHGKQDGDGRRWPKPSERPRTPIAPPESRGRDDRGGSDDGGGRGDGNGRGHDAKAAVATAADTLRPEGPSKVVGEREDPVVAPETRPSVRD